MKKEIMNIVKNGGIFKLNCISHLHAWIPLVDQAAGKNNVKLEIRFDQVNHVQFSFSREIHSRDFEGIIDECTKATDEFAKAMSEELIKCMKHGYIK